MHARAIKQAVGYFLQAYWGLRGGTDVKWTTPPGRPVQTNGAAWVVAIHDGAQTFEGLIGYYARHGCVLTLSARLVDDPASDLAAFLDRPGTGFNDVRDALCAFLHKWRWAILEWANKLASAQPVGGIVTNMVEAPRPITANLPTPRGPEWWGDSVGPSQSAATTIEEARTAGVSCDIQYGQALMMQNESPAER